MIQPGGRVEFYPNEKEKSSAGELNGNLPAVAPEDDVD
jgi:hypothetical protein